MRTVLQKKIVSSLFGTRAQLCQMPDTVPDIGYHWNVSKSTVTPLCGTTVGLEGTTTHPRVRRYIDIQLVSFQAVPSKFLREKRSRTVKQLRKGSQEAQDGAGTHMQRHEGQLRIRSVYDIGLPGLPPYPRDEVPQEFNYDDLKAFSSSLSIRRLDQFSNSVSKIFSR